MITVDTVEEINYLITNGTSQLEDRSGLESAIMSAYQTFEGEYLVKDSVDRIIMVFSHLITTQYFTDGNKRTAFEVLIKLLRQEGLTLSIPKSKIIETSYMVVDHRLKTLSEIRRRLEV